MNKKLLSSWIGIFLGIVLLGIFSLEIFKILYFNEKYYKVPNLSHYTVDEVKNILEKNNLQIKIMGEEFSQLPIGEIFLQEPEAGSIVKKGRTIKAWVSKGAALVDVPNLTGMNYLDAKVIAEQKGLIVDSIVTIKTQGEYNEVIATDPVSNTLLTRGEKISFLVNGAEQVFEIKMPDLIGRSFDEALDLLTKNSLIIGDVNFISVPGIERNVIIKSSTAAGKRIPAGSAVDLTISN